MGKWRAIIPIAFALFIAFVGSVFLYQWLRKAQAPVSQKGPGDVDVVTVAVAAVDLPLWSKITREKIKTAPFLKKSLPPDYFSDPADIEGRIVLTSMKPDEPVLASKLASEKVTVGGVSAAVKPGKRAVSVKGDKVIGISGFVRPADRVDVIATLKDKRHKRKITKTVLKNILVLATGAQIEENAKGEPYPVDVYTLEVTPEEGEILAFAAAEGKLQLALRNNTDDQLVSTRGATLARALGTGVSAVRAGAGRRKPDFILEIVKGDQIIASKKKIEAGGGA
jgi:pilus assembly protein CpaB